MPDLVLAQRVVEREWTTPTDSAAIASRLPGARSEPAALFMSALVPGAGELYVGENSGYFFLAAEVAGWVSWLVFRGDARDLRKEAEGIAGAPDDPASGWTFERWSDATSGDPTELRRLYDGSEAFYDEIAADERYAQGGRGSERDRSAAGSRSTASTRREPGGDGAVDQHVLSAVDALRAAGSTNCAEPRSRAEKT